MLTDTSSSPYAKLHGISFDAIRWTGGFWHQQVERCHDVMIPNMWRLLADPDISHALANFKIAAGHEPGEHHGHPWLDGDTYKWLEAVAAVYAITKDAHLDRLMDEFADLLTQVQREDGYIHTPVIIKERQGEEAQPFQMRQDFETYNLGHLMTAACIHYRITGKDNLLSIAKKAGDFLYNFYKAAPATLARFAVCPSHYMGVIELYRATQDERYLELGKNLIEIRDLVEDGTDDNQDRIPFRKQDRAQGHAVRANYLFAGVADVYAETGDVSLLKTLENLWTNVVQQKMYITGGCGALYNGASPDGSPQEDVISTVHQAYGREYQLPNVTAYNETCANIGNILWNWRMFNISGEARFVDVLETVLYNSALAGIGLDGASFFYTNTLRQVSELPFELRMTRQRQPFIECFCCPPNIVRTIAEVGGYAYSLSEEGLWINLYGSNHLDTQLSNGSRIRLEQTTDYPWDGLVKIKVLSVENSVSAMLFRIPSWASSASISVNGEQIEERLRPGRYFKIQRTWLEGDEVALVLPMPARLAESHPMVEETRNQVAVIRGPLVYCLESNDLSPDLRPFDIIIPRTINLEPVSSPDPGLSGITVLRGQAKLRQEDPGIKKWLYRELPLTHLQDVEITLIPYYAWANRGKSEMTVWMPVAW